MDDVAAVIVAAGTGSRFGGPVNKPYLSLNGRPVLVWVLDVFENLGFIQEIVVVVRPEELERCQALVSKYCFQKVKRIAPGGIRRQDSVYRGLQNLSEKAELVAVHDGARPLLTPALLERTVMGAQNYGAAVAAVPLKDTVKISDQEDFVQSTPDRSRLWAVQTPQVFRRQILQTAYSKALKKGLNATDDAFLVEQAGFKVKLITGDYDNLKITTPEDMLIAEEILKRRGPS